MGCANNCQYYKLQNPNEIIKNDDIIIFDDPFFLPDINSLITTTNQNDYSSIKTFEKYIEEYKTYSWLRLNQIYGTNKFSIFGDKINCEDINQGCLGSCYILVALIGLSKRHERIKKLILTKEINAKGVYALRFLIQGEYKIITIDDFIPCNSTTSLPAFSSSKFGEIWLLLIEKAWAKINGSCYMKTWLGTPHEALTSFTEAPCSYLYHKNFINKRKEESLWNLIMTSFGKEWVLCADTEDIDDDCGLVPYHAYSIIKVFNLTKYKLKLLQIRNPWGNKEWNRSFSRFSSDWNEEIKKHVGFETMKEGTFFMPFEDYIKCFSWTFLCKYEDDFYYNYSTFLLDDQIDSSNDLSQLDLSSNWDSHLNGFVKSFIIITNKTKCYICLHQPQKRFKENTKADLHGDNSNPLGLIILTKFEKQAKTKDKFGYTLVAADFINWEKIYLEAVLQPGEYHIFCKSLSKHASKLVISTYADYQVEVFKLNTSKDWLKDILYGLVSTNEKRSYLCGKDRTSFSSHILFEHCNIGHGIIYYKNNSKIGIMKVKVTFKIKEGINIYNYDERQGENCYIINVPSMDSQAIYLEYINLPHLCKLEWTDMVEYIY